MPTDVCRSHGQAPRWRWQPTTLRAPLMNTIGLWVWLLLVFFFFVVVVAAGFMAAFLANWELRRKWKRGERTKGQLRVGEMQQITVRLMFSPRVGDIWAICVDLLFSDLQMQAAFEGWAGGNRLCCPPSLFFRGANSKTEVLSRGHLHIFASGEVTNVATKNIVCRRSIFIGHPLLLNYVKVFLGLGKKNTKQNKVSCRQILRKSPINRAQMWGALWFYLSVTISNVQKKMKHISLVFPVCLLCSVFVPWFQNCQFLNSVRLWENNKIPIKFDSKETRVDKSGTHLS